MSDPRFVEKGQVVFASVSAVGQQFRFVPKRDVIDSIWFIFASCVLEYGLLVHEFCFMSNHFHIVATDPDGRWSDFLQDFDSMLARQLNALRGTSGTNFERNPPWQRICDAGGVLAKCVYTLVNPLASHLVQRLKSWKHVTSYGLKYGKTITLQRPKCGIWKETRSKAAKGKKGKYASKGRLRYRGRSKAPESVKFTLARPEVELHLSDKELRQKIWDGAVEQERALIVERKRDRRPVLGWRQVVLCRWDQRPGSERTMFQRRPKVTAAEPEAAAEMLDKMQAFVCAYRVAMAEHKAGGRPLWPYGTFRMARRYNLPCATAPP